MQRKASIELKPDVAVPVLKSRSRRLGWYVNGYDVDDDIAARLLQDASLLATASPLSALH